MGFLNVDLGDLGVVPHHFERAVAQERLKREEIPAGPQVRDGEGVPESVRVTTRHLGLRAQPSDQNP